MGRLKPCGHRAPRHYYGSGKGSKQDPQIAGTSYTFSKHQCWFVKLRVMQRVTGIEKILSTMDCSTQNMPMGAPRWLSQ